MRKRKEYLDERQQIERGKAFRNAFLTISFALIICCTINGVLDKPILDFFAMMMIPLWLSISVFLTTVILRDAIFLNNKENQAGAWLTLAICWGITGICLLGIFIIEILRPENGSESMPIAKAVMGICMIEISVAYFIKRIRDRRKAKAVEEA